VLVLVQSESFTTDFLEALKQAVCKIMGIGTIKWGLVAAAIWFGIYQAIVIINGTPLF